MNRSQLKEPEFWQRKKDFAASFDTEEGSTGSRNRASQKPQGTKEQTAATPWTAGRYYEILTRRGFWSEEYMTGPCAHIYMYEELVVIHKLELSFTKYEDSQESIVYENTIH